MVAFKMLYKNLLVHYCNIHGVHSFFSSFFVVCNFIVLTNFVDET